MSSVYFVKEELEVITGNITITAASATKEYDTTPLTDPSYTVTINALSSNKRVLDNSLFSVQNILITGSQTVVGMSSNEITIGTGGIKYFYNTEDITGICQIEYNLVSGTLTVTNRDA